MPRSCFPTCSCLASGAGGRPPRGRKQDPVWSGGKQVGRGSAQEGDFRQVDPVRCWIIAICWMAASAVEYIPQLRSPHEWTHAPSTACTAAFHRRRRFILDFALAAHRPPCSDDVLLHCHSDFPLLSSRRAHQCSRNCGPCGAAVCEEGDEQGSRVRIYLGRRGNGQSASRRLVRVSTYHGVSHHQSLSSG